MEGVLHQMHPLARNQAKKAVAMRIRREVAVMTTTTCLRKMKGGMTMKMVSDPLKLRILTRSNSEFRKPNLTDRPRKA